MWRKSTHSGGTGECAEVAAWRKSTFSESNGDCAEVAAWRAATRCLAGECAEVAAWRKSSASAGNGACVEAGQGAAVVGVRDSKLAESPVLTFGGAAWTAFLARLRA